MKVLDLFSGIGGFSLGLERAGMETIAFCEIEPFCREVLKKHWPSVPIYEDIKKLDGGKIEADVICGGYPCQPFSVAGNRRGEEDDRHLWPEMFRIIKEVRPSWVICENVYGHVSMGLDEVLSNLGAEGYSTKVFIVPACGLDAPHRRNRVWIVANSSSPASGGGEINNVCNGQERRSPKEGSEGIQPKDRKSRTGNAKSGSKTMADTNNEGLQRRQKARNPKRGRKERNKQPTGCDKLQEWRNWEPEPPVGRVANGIPRRVDRLKALGNAVVPQIPEQIGRVIMEIERLKNDS